MAVNEAQPGEDELREAILAAVRVRGPERTICPSEVARAHGGAEWRALMEPVRAAARGLVAEGAIEMTQGGRPVDPTAARGPVRLRVRER